MLAAGLHAIGGNSPDCAVEIDFGPSCVEHFACARRRENEELERERGHALLLAQLRHEGADLGVGQGGVMFDALDLGAGGQEFVEMAAPAGRVVAVAIARAPSPNRARFQFGRGDAKPSRSCRARSAQAPW